jgi:hypothetical protein
VEGWVIIPVQIVLRKEEVIVTGSCPDDENFGPGENIEKTYYEFKSE